MKNLILAIFILSVGVFFLSTIPALLVYGYHYKGEVSLLQLMLYYSSLLICLILGIYFTAVGIVSIDDSIDNL